MKSVWNRISDVGVYPELTFSERSRVRITNQITVILSLLNISYYLYALVNIQEQRTDEQWRSYHLLTVVTGLQFIPVLWLNKKRYYTIARLICLVLTSFLLFYNSLMIAEPFRSEVYFFAAAAFAFVIFRDMKFIIPFYFLQMVAYYFSAVSIAQRHPELIAFNSGLAIRVFFSFGMLFLILLFLRKETTSYHDQLEERNAELSLDRDEIQKINFTKDKIFSIISHDLRSPINSFQGLLGLLQRGHLSEEEFKVATATLEKQVAQLQTSIDDLLTWSKAQLHGINPEPQELWLRPLVSETLSMSRLAARKKTIIITSNVEAHTKVFCDPNMLKSALGNLVTNAIKFTPAGGAISIASYPEQDNVKIIVEDTGIGIPKESLEKILNPTIHFTTRGTGNEKGTGLGLKIVMEFIQKNQGTFEIESTVGKGSRFVIALPAQTNLAASS